MEHRPKEPSLDPFPAAGRDAWKKKVAKDLGDTPYDTIVWHTPDGFAIDPWNPSDGSSPVIDIPRPSPGNTWRSCRRVPFDENQQRLSATCRRAIDEGADALEFILECTESHYPETVKAIFAAIEPAAIPVYFSGTINTEALAACLGKIEGAMQHTGGILTPLREDSALPSLEKGATFRMLTIDSTPYHEQGATPATEIACVLAGIGDLLERCQESGIPLDRAVDSMEIVMGIGTTYFTEIAKPRALYALLAPVLEIWGASPGHMPRLFARPSSHCIAAEEPETNLLRLTTATLSAILGGYQTIDTIPFDNRAEADSDNAMRLSGNISLLLSHEAHLDIVADPVRGAASIEALTAGLAEKAREHFLMIEQQGGLGAAQASGLLEKLLSNTLAQSDNP